MSSFFKASKETGVDPRKIHGIEQLDEYTKWITWRADHFTQVLRDLKEGLEAIRAASSPLSPPEGTETGRRVPVAVRVPSAGLFYNMAEGLDIGLDVSPGAGALSGTWSFDPNLFDHRPCVRSRLFVTRVSGGLLVRLPVMLFPLELLGAQTIGTVGK